MGPSVSGLNTEERRASPKSFLCSEDSAKLSPALTNHRCHVSRSAFLAHLSRGTEVLVWPRTCLGRAGRQEQLWLSERPVCAAC